MHKIVVLAHPNKKSLNHAIAKIVVDTLKSNNHKVFFHDLYEEKFDPIMPTRELQLSYEPAPEIEPYCIELQKADGIVIVHPNWWGQLPAILKGWVDRVFMPGVVHSIPKKGEIKTDGLLTQLTALVINTYDVSLKKEIEIFKDPLDTIWKNCIFGFCEAKHCDRILFNDVYQSTESQRAAWLNQVQDKVRNMFPENKTH